MFIVGKRDFMYQRLMKVLESVSAFNVYNINPQVRSKTRQVTRYPCQTWELTDVNLPADHIIHITTDWHLVGILSDYPSYILALTTIMVSSLYHRIVNILHAAQYSRKDEKSCSIL